jgi:hypothetical protein
MKGDATRKRKKSASSDPVRIASRHIADDCHLPGPPSFSLPTTFKGLQAFKSGHKKHCTAFLQVTKSVLTLLLFADYILSKSI